MRPIGFVGASLLVALGCSGSDSGQTAATLGPGGGASSAGDGSGGDSADDGDGDPSADAGQDDTTSGSDADGTATSSGGVDSSGGDSGSTGEPACVDSRKVLAFYYAWYCAPQFGCWDPIPGGEDPALGRYESADPAVLDAHIAAARAAGIDGFVVSWIGHHPGDAANDKTDAVLGMLLDKAAAVGDFYVAIDFEPTFLDQFGMDFGEQMAYVINTHGNHPAFLQIDGKPAIFFWKQELFSDTQWQAVRSYVDANAGDAYWNCDAGPAEEGVASAAAGVFDNAHYYSTWWAASFNAQQQMWSALPGRPTFGTVTPGFRGNFETPSWGVWAGAGTQTYADQWDFVVANDPDYVMITSWNEWPEGTYIEDSSTLGTQLLDLTTMYTDLYKTDCD